MRGFRQIQKNHTRCCRIWKNRLRGQYRTVYRRSLEQILQARGDMKTPMVAQIAGAITNIILDPILIFGMFGIHKFGIAGAAIATVIGQIVAALVVMRKAFVRSPEKSCYLPHIKRIYQLGIPNILMQSAYTFYIFGLNMILAGFSDQAVTALGCITNGRAFSLFHSEHCRPASYRSSASIMRQKIRRDAKPC